MKASVRCYIIYVSIVFQVISCKNEVKEKEQGVQDIGLFRKVPSTQSNINFNNQIEENERYNMVDFFYVYNGAGVAIGDINNDNLPDIYFTGNMVPDRLYINKGGLVFEDVSKSSGIDIPGWSTGVTMVDINHDGLLDIYVCRSGNVSPEERKNLLFVNLGNNQFIEEAEKYGLDDSGFATQALFFDYDKDGDLDMYLLNHSNEIKDPNNIVPLVKDGSGLANDKLYKNNEMETGIIGFIDVTIEAGIIYDGMGLGVGAADFNNDGWDDIYVSNDFIANDYLYINNQDGTFSEMSKSYLQHVSHFAMGNDLSDFNNDGNIDIITVDMLPEDNYQKKKMSGPLNENLNNLATNTGYMAQYMRNTLQINNGLINGELSFSEVGQLFDINSTNWSWAPLLADFDNDGWKDLFITNGYLRDITDLDFINYTISQNSNTSTGALNDNLKAMSKDQTSIEAINYMFKNLNGNGFQNVAQEWGFTVPSLSNGVAYADLDNDGDLDIVVNNINSEAFVYENQNNEIHKNNFLRLNLQGDSLNKNAIGARVTLYQKNTKQTIEQFVSRGYQSSMDYRMNFGLGKSDHIDSLLIRWPDGFRSRHYNIELNREITISKSKSIESNPSNKGNFIAPLFTEVTDLLGIDHLHQEISFGDFNRQFLLPHKHSQQGPGIAVGDLNGDGLDDFFVGGAYNQIGQLFFQMPNGTFKQKPLVGKVSEKNEEDTGVLFFDYDGDGDLDLYISSGSNEFYEGSEFYKDRLYKNDGYGNFVLDTNALPSIRSSTSVVRAADFDQDGDLDLFIGGRTVPLKYPFPPKSYILQNNNGVFKDITRDIAPDLSMVGMVTDAIWTDYDNDGDKDLIVVGEFMPIQFFNNSEGKLTNKTESTGLTFTSGWWNSINAGDFDNDGDIDYIVGNLGLNAPFKISKEAPLTVYAGDYDNNSFIDPIITYFNEGVEYPASSRDDIIRQIPSLKKKFPDYVSYAEADINHLLTQEERMGSYNLKAYNFATSYLENLGNGKFILYALPLASQISPVYGILIHDFNKDGNLDALLTGNNFEANVGIGRYDASIGTLLLGNGKGSFDHVPNLESGLLLKGNLRGSASIVVKDQLVFLFGQNSGSLKAYKIGKDFEKSNYMKISGDITKAKIKYLNNSERLVEFYFGSSYLSQSTRILELTDKEKEISLFYKNGSTKIWKP